MQTSVIRIFDSRIAKISSSTSLSSLSSLDRNLNRRRSSAMRTTTSFTGSRFGQGGREERLYYALSIWQLAWQKPHREPWTQTDRVSSGEPGEQATGHLRFLAARNMRLNLLWRVWCEKLQRFCCKGKALHTDDHVAIFSRRTRASDDIRWVFFHGFRSRHDSFRKGRSSYLVERLGELFLRTGGKNLLN